MILYIAGPISGQLDYKSKFKAAESKLKEMGHIVVNPSFLPDGLREYNDYIHICKAMIDKVDAIYMLDDWIYSKGAKIEKAYAESLKKPIYYESVW